MSKETLSNEIQRELEKLNDIIDRNIIKGRPYQKEARRHRELSLTLMRIRAEEDAEDMAQVSVRRATRRGKSPVRRRLAGGSFRRLFGFGLAG